MKLTLSRESNIVIVDDHSVGRDDCCQLSEAHHACSRQLRVALLLLSEHHETLQLIVPSIDSREPAWSMAPQPARVCESLGFDRVNIQLVKAVAG